MSVISEFVVKSIGNINNLNELEHKQLLLPAVDVILSREIDTDNYIVFSYAELSGCIFNLTEVEVFNKQHPTLPSIKVQDIIEKYITSYTSTLSLLKGINPSDVLANYIIDRCDNKTHEFNRGY